MIPLDGRKHLSPDVFIALHAGPARRESWKTWIEGTFPEIVLEVASPSTRQRDIQEKVALYSQLGVREYYVFDPAGALTPAFRGYQLDHGQVALLPKTHGEGILSPLLQQEFRVVAGWLRLIDPLTAAPYLLPAEAQAQAKEAQARAEAAYARAELERDVSRKHRH